MTMDRFDDEDSDDDGDDGDGDIDDDDGDGDVDDDDGDGDSDDYGQVYSQKKKTSSSSKYFRPAYSISCNNPGSDLAGEAQNDIVI